MACDCHSNGEKSYEQLLREFKDTKRRVDALYALGVAQEELGDHQAVRDGDGCCLYASNFSLGVQALFCLVRRAGELFAGLPEYAAFVEERHHDRKKDAPSGTAVRLADVVARALGRSMEDEGVYGRRGMPGRLELYGRFTSVTRRSD